MSDEASTQPVLQTFSMHGGLIESDAGQAAVDDFAADFQGLRHFGTRVGESLELGAPLIGCFREPDFTLMFACEEGTDPGKADGAGARISQRLALAPLLDLLLEPSSTQESASENS